VDPVDPDSDSDPDPQHWLEDTLFSSYFHRQIVLYPSVAELAERGGE
jgi:hypothetical protein